MQIFDMTQLSSVTNPPMEFQPDAHYTGFGNAHNIVINEETGYAFAVGTDQFGGGPIFLNLSDPLNPVAEGGHDQNGYTHDAQAVIYTGPDENFGGKELYFGSQGNSGFAIVDISDKSDPQEIFASSYVDQSYTHQGWLTEDQHYFLMNDEIDELDFGFNTRTLVWDVSDLANSFLVGSYSGPTLSTDHNLYTSGNLVYMSNYNSGLRIAEMTDLSTATMTEVAYFDVWPSTDAAGYTGTWSNYPYFPSGNIVISAFHGFYVVGDLPLSIAENPSEAFIISPNPTEGRLTLTSRGDIEINSIQVYDLSGRLVMQESVTNPYSQQYNFSVEGISTGTYIVQVNNNSLTSRKLSVR
jgi:choice-of-anchor B domain-containing protein